MAKYAKQTGIRLSDDIQNIGWNNIKIRATFKKGKPETFSDYIRNLIIEDFNRNKQKIKKMLKQDGL